MFEGGELILGRGKDAGVVIDDAKASRRHAMFGYSGGELFVQDLGSINGTFVNGERVEKRALFPGDAIEIANVRFRAELRPVPESNSKPGSEAGLSHSMTATMGNILASRLDSDKVREILEFLEARERTGAVVVRTTWGTGKIYLSAGQIYHAEINRCPAISARKALQRLLRAQEGSVEFSIGESVEVEVRLDDSLEKIATEDEGYVERFARLEQMMPSLDARLEVIEDKGPPPGDDEVFELARKGGNLSDVMDAYSGSDTEVIRALIRMADQHTIRFVR